MHQEALTKEGVKLLPLLHKFESFYLAGGTALALQIGHRISVDFDFFSDTEISKGLLSQVIKIFDGQSISTAINNRDELTIFVSGVKITFLKYPFPNIEKLVQYQGISLLGIKDIASTKAYTVGRRGSYKDYVDLYFILSEKFSTLNEIINFARRKYGTEFNDRLFLEQLLFMDDLDDLNIQFLKPAIFKEKIEMFFREEIKQLYSNK